MPVVTLQGTSGNKMDVDNDSAGLVKVLANTTTDDIKNLLDSIATNCATEATVDAILTELGDIDFSTETTLDAIKTILTGLADEDFATQTTLAQILTKLTSDPSTATKQDSIKDAIDTLAETDFATDTTLSGIDFATETTLAGIDFATETTLAAIQSELEDITTELQAIKANQTNGLQQSVMVGTVLAEQKTDTDAISDVITFSEDIYAIEIYHSEVTAQQFTVNGFTLTVPPGGYRTALAGTPGDTVTIPTAVTCIVGRLV